MQPARKYFLVLVVAALASSPSQAKKYQAPADKPTATITLVASNDSAAETNIRGSRMEIFDPTDCSKHWKLDSFFLKKLSARAGKPVAIEAGSQVGLSFSYSDGRFAENRSCAVSGFLTPEPGAQYVARFNVDKEVDTCAVTLSRQDATGAAVSVTDFELRPLVCLEDPRTELASGKGYRLIWKISVEAHVTPQ